MHNMAGFLAKERQWQSHIQELKQAQTSNVVMSGTLLTEKVLCIVTRLGNVDFKPQWLEQWHQAVTHCGRSHVGDRLIIWQNWGLRRSFGKRHKEAFNNPNKV
jgi:hypothetical protein